MISCTILNLLLFLDCFARLLCLISSSFKPCSHEADTFLELDLYLLFKSNDTIKSAVLCTLCFLAELKTACIMPWLMPPYWRCKLWWHLILRTYWMQGTPWRKLKLPVKGKNGAIQSVNSSFLGKFWKTTGYKRKYNLTEITGKLRLEGTSGGYLAQPPAQRRVTAHKLGCSAV